MKKIGIIISLLLVVVIASYAGYVIQHYEVPILMYHSLDASRIGSYAAVSPQRFREQMRIIKEGGYKVMELEEYCRLLKEGIEPPRKSLVITFDDGHKDNLVAAKILEEFGFPSTIFLIVDKLGQTGYLSQEDVRFLLKEGNVDIGSHTLNEVYLPDAPAEVLTREIAGSRKKLKQLFGEDINTFSYTIGGFNKTILEAVEQAGYLCACTTNRGYDRGLNRFALRRIKITERDRAFRLKAKLSGHYNIFRRLKKPH